MIESFEVAELAVDLSFEGDSSKEPFLKYTSIVHGITDLTSTDNITCLASHNKFLAIGTALGRVHILDHEGFVTENGVHNMHRGPVNQISISANGDFMASCSDDGRVAVCNLLDIKENEVFSFDEPVKSVAISPDYSRSPVVAFGHSKLLLLTRGMFKRNKHGEVAKANGSIRNIQWRGDILVWADDSRVGVYDLRDHQHISFMQFCQQTSNLYTRHIPCHINWCTDTCFLIGRGSSLRICQILERYQRSESRSSSKSSISHSSSIHLPDADSPMGLSNRYLELSYQVDLVDSLVCGLSRHQTQLLALIVPNIATSSQSNIISLELQVIEVDDLESTQSAVRCPVFHKEQQTWIILRGQRGYADISLETVPGENTHYIVTPKQLICAAELTIDDRIDWLLAHEKFEQALQLTLDHPRQLASHTSQSVGITYIDHLLEKENFESAARLCADVITEKQLWEQQISKFMQLGQLLTLVPFIPIDDSLLMLDHSVYEAILVHFMDRDPSTFVDLLSTWSRRGILDSFDGLLRILLERIERQTSFAGISETTIPEPGLRNLWQALAILYELVGSCDKALDILVQLRDPRVFDLFEKKAAQPVDPRLLEVLKERIDYFMRLDAPKAVSILLEHVSIIPVEHVVEQLERHPDLLYHYLDGAYVRHPKLVAPYTTQLIHLYSRFGREKLLPLLRSTDSYRLSEALAICENSKLIPETVYLLTRVGRRHDALHLIMTQGGESNADQDNEAGSTLEDKQAAAAAAAIAYCCEEDSFRSRFGSKFSPSTSGSIFGLRPVDETRVEVDTEAVGEHDGELWQQVVLFAVDKPAFICALLQHAGSEGLDPRLLLRKISPELSIPGLRDSLVKLMRNYKLQLELHRSCRRILHNVANQLLQKLIEEQARGICIQPGGFSVIGCSLCSHQLVKGRSIESGTQPQQAQAQTDESQPCCVVFRCKHICHFACLPTDRSPPTCPICAKS